MTFSLFSVAVILLTAALIAFGIRKSLKLGLRRALISLAATLACIFAALMLSKVIARPLGATLSKLISNTGMLDKMVEAFPSVDDIIGIVANAIAAPIIFIIVYFVCRAVIVPITRIIEQKYVSDFACPEDKVNGEDTWIKRHQRAVSIAAGAAGGLITAMVIISPISGTFRMAGTLLGMVSGEDAMIKGVNIDEDIVNGIDRYANDLPSLVLYETGGKYIYSLAATSRYEGETVYLAKEVGAMDDALSDFSMIKNALSDMSGLDGASTQAVKEAVDSMNESTIVRLVAADFISNAATRWSEGNDYMNMQRPDFGALGDDLVDDILEVFSTETHKTVCEDISTVLSVLDILRDGGILTESDYENMLANIEANDTLNGVCNELKKNPRMAHITTTVYHIALRATATAITNTMMEYQYDSLMEDMADTWNTISQKSYDYQIEYISRNTKDYAEQYGVQIPETAAQITAEAITEWFSGNDEVTSQEIDYFIQFYSHSN